MILLNWFRDILQERRANAHARQWRDKITREAAQADWADPLRKVQEQMVDDMRRTISKMESPIDSIFRMNEAFAAWNEASAFRYLLVWYDPALGGHMAKMHEQDARLSRHVLAAWTNPCGVSEKPSVQRHYAKEKNCSVIVRVRMK